jgi:EAL domain-containing protein (putative c-di-GMP-specific phosphodiesterase class I)
MTKFRNTLRENDLREMLQHDSLDLYYQPRIDPRNGQIVGMEALVHWPLFDTKTLPVDCILDATTDDLLLQAMSDYIFRKACAQNARWVRQGHTQLNLALSLSLQQLANRDFPTQLATILGEEGLPPDQLELEINEGVLMEVPERFPLALTRLKGLGVQITINGFGTGYSSLAFLRRTLIDSLKIDRLFVSGLGFNPDDDAIVSAIIAMANNLELTTIAIGVETKEQLRFLQREGCDRIQGSFHSQPLPPKEFTETLELYRLLDKTRGAAAELSAQIRGYHT